MATNNNTTKPFKIKLLQDGLNNDLVGHLRVFARVLTLMEEDTFLVKNEGKDTWSLAYRQPRGYIENQIIMLDMPEVRDILCELDTYATIDVKDQQIIVECTVNNCTFFFKTDIDKSIHSFLRSNNADFQFQPVTTGPIGRPGGLEY